MTTRCFVTGGAGFIGSHLTDALLRRGCAVTVYDDLSLGRREHLAGALAAGARLVEADLLDLERLTAELAGHHRVWHLAASSDIRQGTRSTRLDLEQGTLVTYNVLEAMRRCGVEELAFASSSVVYGEPAVMPTPEDHGPLQPISLYGAAKLAAGDAAYLASRTGLQVHGAIGYTAEFDLSLWITKIRALLTAWGTPAYHRSRLLAELSS